MRLVAQPLDEIQHRVAWLKFDRLAVRHEQRLAAGIALRTLGDRQQRDLAKSQFLEDFVYRVELAAAAVDDDEIGPLRKRIVIRFCIRFWLCLCVCFYFGRLAFGRRQEPLEAPLQDLAHHGVIVARRQAFGLDVELAVLVLDETVRPRHDHGADRVGALDMAVVVDLDPPQWVRQAERCDQRLQQPALGRGVGELAPQRLARIGQCVRDQFLFFPAFGHRDFDL